MKIKRIFTFSLVLFMFSGVVYGGSFLIEAKGMYFLPKDQNFKDIYGAGNGFSLDWVCYGGEIGITLFNGVSIWAGGHYFKNDKGKLSVTEEDTTLTIMPLYGGIKLRLSQGAICPYIGGGVGYFQYKEENIIGTVQKGDIGYIGQAGLILKVDVLIIDLQVSYTYCKVQPEDIEAHLGGIHGGIGIGFEF